MMRKTDLFSLSRSGRTIFRLFFSLLLIFFLAFGSQLAAQAQVETRALSSPTPEPVPVETLAIEPQALSGTLNILWGDSSDGYSSKVMYRLSSEEGVVTSLVLDETTVLPPGGIWALNGKQVTVSGTRRTESLDDPGAAASLLVSMISGGPQEEAGLVTLDVTGSQPWVSIMCKFSDFAAEPNDLAYFQGMYSNVKPGLDHYWREMSYNIVNVAGSSASGWFDLPQPKAYYVYDMDWDGEEELNYDRIANDCTAAADSSVDFTPYMGINMMFNTDLDCTPAGCWAWGGTRDMTLDGVTKTWSITYEPPWSYSDISVIMHEMGHGFGLPHSSYDTAAVYDNVWDVMSRDRYNCPTFDDATYGCKAQHTISYHKDLLGWVGFLEKYTYDGVFEDTITLEQLALPATDNYKMAQIPIGGSSSHFYTVEARRLTGYDEKLPGAAVIIHEVNTGDEIPAILIDEDDDGITSDDGAMWVAGEAFIDAANSIAVHVDSAAASGFVVTISDMGIVDIRAPNLVVGEEGVVEVVVEAPEDNDYKVRIWDDNGISNPAWDWDWTESGILPIQKGEKYSFLFYTTPTTTSEAFEFWVYKKDFLGLYKIIEKVEYTLYASSTPSDTTPPVVTGHTSTPDPATLITATFSEDMLDTTFTSQNVTVYGSGSGSHSASYSFNHATHILTIDPTTNFLNGETVDVTIGTGVTDLAGNHLASPYHFSFVITSAPTYTVSGAIRDTSNNPINGVTVSIGAFSAITVNGQYSISGIPAGTYAVVPTLSGYQFTPSPQSVTLPPSQTLNFTGTQSHTNDTFTFFASDDVFLRQAYPSEVNNGSCLRAGIEWYGGYQKVIGLLKFADLLTNPDIQGKTVYSAALRLYPAAVDANTTLRVWQVGSSVYGSWNESTTYATFPYESMDWYDNLGQAMKGSISVPVSTSSQGTWLSITGSTATIKSAVQAVIDRSDPNYGFLIDNYYSNVDSDPCFGSSESSYPPRLEIQVLTGVPDLVVNDITTTPAPAGGTTFNVGQSINIEYTVFNNGPGGADYSRAAIYLGSSPTDYSHYLDDFSSGQLLAGEDDVDDLDYTFTSSDIGTRYIIVKADWESDVSETNENNNLMYIGPFTVVQPNTPPAISGLPDISLNEDASQDNAVDLWAYAADAQSQDSDLIFSIQSITNSLAGVSIDGDRYLDVQPAANWNGTADVTIQVQDPQGLSAADTLRVTVNPVNDLPWIAPAVADQNAAVDQPISIDLTPSERDIEDSGTALDWYVTGQDNCTVSGAYSDSDLLTFTPASGFNGSDTVVLHLVDSSGGEATQELTLTWVPPQPPPSAPTDLALTPVSQTQIDLSWTDNSTDESDFHIERSPDGASNWAEIATVGANVTTYSSTGLSCGTTYFYRVRAQRHADSAFSAYSNTASSATLPCTPPGSFGKTSPASGSPNQSITPTLSWQSTSPLTWFEYCYDTSNDGDCSNWTNNGANTSVVLPALSYATTYYWQVRAWNNAVGPTFADGALSAFWSFTTIPDPTTTFSVNSFADAVDASPGNGACATSANVCTLRAAIQEANLRAGMNWIVVPAGTYMLTLAGAGEDAGATGDLDITDSLAIIGAGQAATIVDGNDIDRVFDIPSSTAAVEIRHMTIQNGTASDIGGGILNRGILTLTSARVTASAAVSGAGIFHGGTIENNMLTLVDSIVDNNQGTGNGGGIAGYQSSITLENSQVNLNSALNGGGVYIDHTRAVLTLDNATLDNNAANNAGGIYAYNSAVNIASSTLTRNHASQNAGGIRCYQNVLTISGDTDIGVIGAGNTADDNNDNVGVGGGIYAYQCPVQITGFGNSIAGNSAAGGGGLYIYNSVGGSSYIENTVINGNQVHYSTGGGGIYNNSQVALKNVTISGNTSWYGGGIGNYNTYANMLLTNVTVTNNTATYNSSDGISHTTGALLRLENTIVANNVGSGCSGTGTITSLGHNLSSDSTCSLTDPSDITNANPMLESLSDNGGSTLTHALSPGSPAIDAANPATCPVTDQRGVNRPIDGNNDGAAVCDIGAYEAPAIICSAPEIPTLVSPQNDTTTNDNTPTFDWSAANHASEYQLQVDDDAGFTSLVIDSTTAATDFTPGAALSDGILNWRVRGHNTQNNCNVYGSWSPAWQFTIDTPEPPPGAPSGLSAAVVSQTQVDLIWTDNSTDESDFHIERSPDGTSSWVEIATVGANVTTYSSTGLSCGTTYFYRVRAQRHSDSAFSAYSNTASAATEACETTLAAPTDLMVSVNWAVDVTLTWSDNSADETEFRVERSSNINPAWEEIAVRPANATMAQSSVFLCASQIYFRVRAYRQTDGQYSDYSNIASYTANQCILPNPPTNLSAYLSTPDQIDLSWDDESNDENAFSIEQSTGSASDWNVIQITGPNVTSATVEGVSPGVTYYFRVRAYRSGDMVFTTYTNVASVGVSQKSFYLPMILR